MRPLLPDLRGVVAVAVLLAAAGGVSRAAGQDNVALVSGRTIAGVTVVRDGFDKVEIDRDGDGKADELVDAIEVKDVSYGDAPLAYRQGSVYFKQGRYAEAAKYFVQAVEDEKARPWIKAYAGYYAGECRRHLGAAEKAMLVEARLAYEQAVKADPRGRLAPYAVRGIGLCFMEEGKALAAGGEFGKLMRGEYGNEWILGGKLLNARLLSQAGKHEDAKKLCEEVRAAAEKANRPALTREARIARSEVLLAAGEYAKAREIFYEIAREADERDVKTRARAYNAIADCFLGEKKTREALLAYLRVRVVYFEASDELPRALYGAALCFTKLRQPERARELLAVLEKEHAGSPWTQKAKKELGG